MNSLSFNIDIHNPNKLAISNAIAILTAVSQLPSVGQIHTPEASTTPAPLQSPEASPTPESLQSPEAPVETMPLAKFQKIIRDAKDLKGQDAIFEVFRQFEDKLSPTLGGSTGKLPADKLGEIAKLVAALPDISDMSDDDALDTVSGTPTPTPTPADVDAVDDGFDDDLGDEAVASTEVDPEAVATALKAVSAKKGRDAARLIMTNNGYVNLASVKSADPTCSKLAAILTECTAAL